ncbi:Iron-hydroxamate transporter, permease subunit [Neorhizobium galegae bv. officinalis]|uniref:Fe(3+)-hydroxamate ABC transporter permease FhuB n=1 Tax=Neorhizobium galegae TaxID=399 RepID=UPI000622AA3C|nr:Iron-hydroxamate transporter, permease subunit [Neorhizobium galegae bv. officinalis]CDZ38354.1 Iron-hydroxamate transporter, permease subunit [Neorhizobium galegae bv. officinalis]
MSGTVSLHTPMRTGLPHLLPAAALGIACVTSFILLLMFRPHVPGEAATAAVLDTILLWNSLLPRAAIALISGAALGLSGALLQRILRNPIADASTLGIASGAQLALTLGLSFLPLLTGISRELLAFAGGFSAVAIVLALSWRGLDPVTVAISGMIVSLIAASLSVTLVLARGEYAMSIHIWGAGALNQQDWSGVVALAPRLAAGILAAALLLRPLRVLALDDSSARSLGVALQGVRFSILVLAVWLSASVTATVGIIGFLGLAAPTMARFCGARTTGQVMMAAPLAGAAVLFLADCLTQLLGPGFSDLVPTGAATALLGGPLLLLLLPRVHGFSAATATADAASRQLRKPAAALLLLAAALAIIVALVLTLSPTDHGWSVALGPLFSELLPFRLPRILASGGAGAMLGAAGFIMQRVTGNPIASPEVLGVSSGGGAGLTAALFLFGFPSPAIMLLGMALGSLAAFLVMIAIAGRSGFSAERLLLAGIAISAFCMAIVSMVLAQGDMRSYILLTWMSGSTNRAGAFEAWTAMITLVVLTAPLFLMIRWLAILPLGTSLSRGVGLRVLPSRLVLAILAALMTAISSFLVGPLSLTGLIAPHLARLVGFRNLRCQLAAAILIGAGVLIVADWLSRVVIYPYQVPVGLFAALIGGPYLLWLLGMKERSP